MLFNILFLSSCHRDRANKVISLMLKYSSICSSLKFIQAEFHKFYPYLKRDFSDWITIRITEKKLL